MSDFSVKKEAITELITFCGNLCIISSRLLWSLWDKIHFSLCFFRIYLFSEFLQASALFGDALVLLRNGQRILNREYITLLDFRYQSLMLFLSLLQFTPSVMSPLMHRGMKTDFSYLPCASNQLLLVWDWSSVEE